LLLLLQLYIEGAYQGLMSGSNPKSACQGQDHGAKYRTIRLDVSNVNA